MVKRRYKKVRRPTRSEIELEKVGRELEVRAEKAWREWMFGKNIDNIVAKK